MCRGLIFLGALANDLIPLAADWVLSYYIFIHFLVLRDKWFCVNLPIFRFTLTSLTHDALFGVDTAVDYV